MEVVYYEIDKDMDNGSEVVGVMEEVGGVLEMKVKVEGPSSGW